MGGAACFIGNSHLVAFKLAWDEIGRNYAGLTIDMFGSPMNWLPDLEYKDGKIVPTSSRLEGSFVTTSSKKYITLDSYDQFCLVAGGFDVGIIVDRLATHYPYGCKTKSANLVSYDCFKTAIVDAMHDTLAAKIFRMIRQGSSAPLYLFVQPFRGEALLTVGHPRGKHDYLKTLIQNGDDQLVLDIFRDASAEFAAKTGIHIVHQPDETRIRSILTKSIYNEDAVRMQPGFNAKHKKGDCVHTNKAFGIIVLKDFLETQQGSLRPTPQNTPAASPGVSERRGQFLRSVFGD
jgi:hypothetical protein